MTNRKLILDTETTGLDYENDKVIEIGIIELISGIRTNNNFHVYINPERKISLEAQNVHGLSNDFLKKENIFSKIANDFLDFINNDTLIIHNSIFDITFLNKELENCGKNKISNPIIDTISLARNEFPGQAVNLDSLCRKLNILNTRNEFHGALLDADLLCKVYLKLTTGKQELLNLEKNKINKENKVSSIKKPMINYQLTLNKLSETEIEMHQKLIEKMKDPIWKKI